MNSILFCAVLLSVCANYGFGRVLNERIIGGTVASPNQFPYQAGLLNEGEVPENGTLVFCGGAIIDNQWVLTAARCVHRRQPADFRVLVSSVNVIVDNEEVHSVESIHLHPDFVVAELLNDIALLRLAQPLEWSESVLPIALKSRFIDGGVRSVVSGYGITAINTPSMDLRYLTTYTIENEDCREQLGNRSRFVHDSVVCTGQLPNAGTCLGDIGSPLVAGGRVFGLVTWFATCGQGGPNGYTRVSSYLDWIAQVSGVVIIE